MERKRILGWAFYDWANSAFATTVMAGFFPVFFKSFWNKGADAALSTARLGFGNAGASLCVALCAPLLGAIADKGGAKKRFLLAFAYLGVCTTAALALVAAGKWVAALVLYTIAVVGFSASNIFYDALLPEVSGNRSLESVSGFGYAMGYLGGGLLFLLNVLMVSRPETFGLADRTSAVRYSFLTVALWWGGFTLFTAFWVPESGKSAVGRGGAVLAAGLRQLADTLRKLAGLRNMRIFLLAYWLYMDGVDTVVRMAVDYGLSLGLRDTDLVTALLVTQFVGFPASLAFGAAGKKWGPKRGIYVALGVYILVTGWAIFIRSRTEFFILACMIGLVQGGVQALSRSYFARFIPQGMSGEFYGFYNMLGKFAAIIGPALVGGVALAVRAALGAAAPGSHLPSRLSIASLLILFGAGAFLLRSVNEEHGVKEALRFGNMTVQDS